MDLETLRADFERQAKGCEELGSPFTAALLRGLPGRLDPNTAFGAAIFGWPGDLFADALGLRVAGALHALVRSGRDPRLAAAWPPDSAPDPAARAVEAVARHDAWLRPWLDSPPQTNEVARSAPLLGGALILAARHGLPLELLEIGASAGLNLGFDGHRYDLGDGRSWGDPEAPVAIDTHWSGALPPLDAPMKVARRAACDLNPVDPGDPAARERMLAYIWPDQRARLARTQAALDAAAAKPWRVERASADLWLEDRLARPRPAGATRVVLNTVMWLYMPEAVQARIVSALEGAGAQASPDRPLAWLRLDHDGDRASAGLTLTTWPGGETETLARSCWHGRWTEWL